MNSNILASLCLIFLVVFNPFTLPFYWSKEANSYLGLESLLFIIDLFAFISSLIYLFKKNLVQKLNLILINLFVFILFFFIIDRIIFFPKVKNQAKFAKSNWYENDKPTQFTIKDNTLGYKPKSLAKTQVVKYLGRDTIFHVLYETDQYGRRIYSSNDSSPKKEYALLFGCSFTFGAGLNGEETIGAIIEKNTLNYRQYNYGIAGHGTGSMLALLENNNIQKQIIEKTGKGFYFILPTTHLNRTIGSSQVLSTGMRELPYYKLKKGKVIRKGFLRDKFKTRLYSLLWLSSAYRLYPIADRALNKKDYLLQLEMIKKSFELYNSQFNNEEFYVVFHPLAPNAQNEELIQIYTSFFDENHIKYLNYSSLISPIDKENYIIPLDGHPNFDANVLLVNHLIEDLKLK